MNLIPFNPHEGSGFEPPAEARIGELCALLAAKGLTVSVRRSRGQDVAGACGQLVRERSPDLDSRGPSGKLNVYREAVPCPSNPCSRNP